MSRRYKLWGACAALAVACWAPSSRGADNLWNVANGDYNTPSNWNPAIVPSVFADERAVISNGGTANVTSQPGEPAAVTLGLNAGNTGTLNINSGGNLSVLSSGSATGTGGVTVGAAGTGTLRVLPGGSLTTAGPLASGASAANLIVLGSAAAGTANVNVASASFGGTTQVFKNTSFTTNGGSIALGATSVYAPVIDAGAGGAALLDAGFGAVSLGGALRPTFTFTPALGATWNLLHGASVAGSFSSLQATGLGPGQRIKTTIVGSAGDQNLQLSIDQVLSLTVNRNTGAVSIANLGAAARSFDGYTIQSPSGRLNRAAFNSLDDQNTLGGDWLESTGSNNTRLSELKPTSQGTLAGATSIGLGNVFAPLNVAPGPFGTQADDITFTYTQADGSVIAADVNYTGIANINNLVLQVDPADGKARIKNTSAYTVQIDGYSITSATGSINRAAWTSFDDQNVSDWLESTGSNANKIGELKPTSSTTFAAGATAISMGNMFTVGGTRDLEFKFVLAGESTPMTGTVVYDSYAAGNADFDSDGDVDGNDFLRWQRNVGGVATLANGNANGDGVINGADLAVWRDQFGNVQPSASAAAGAVPEPATLWLGALAAALAGSCRRAAGARIDD